MKMGQTNTLVIVSIMFIVTVMMIVVFVLTPKVDISVEEAFLTCPGANEPFSRKKFIKTDTCYNVSSRSCLDILKDVNGGLDAIGVDKDELDKAMGVIINNTYKNKNSPDSDEFYSISQCIIPKHYSESLGMKNCKLGSVQLQNGNPKEQDVLWDNEGCVLTEKHLRNDITSIIKSINDVYYQPKENAKNKLTSGIQNNRYIEDVNWKEHNKNMSDSKIQETLRDAAIMEVQQSNIQINNSKADETEHNMVVSRNNPRIKRTRGLTFFLQNKLFGLRYAVYRGYWGYKGESLSFFKTFIPYEIGSVKTINNFEGMRGLNTQWQYVSVDIKGIFRPTVSGQWTFALNSDDAAYMWISDIGTDYDEMTLDKADLSRPGLRGMSPGLGNIVTKTLDGSENTPGYKVRIVQGNNGGPGGLVVRVKRPGSNNWEIFGDSPDDYLFSQLEKGLICRVYDRYFWDDLDLLIRNRQPMCTVPLDEIYHLFHLWHNASWGVGANSKYHDFSRIEYTTWDNDKRDYVNKKVLPFQVYPYSADNPGPTNQARSMNISGYFIPPISGKYVFYLSSDDSSYVWLGDSALVNNFNKNNAIAKMPNLHPTWVTLFEYTVNDYEVKTLIPIRIVQGDWGGGNTLAFGYLTPGDIKPSYDLSKDFRF